MPLLGHRACALLPATLLSCSLLVTSNWCHSGLKPESCSSPWESRLLPPGSVGSGSSFGHGASRLLSSLRRSPETSSISSWDTFLKGRLVSPHPGHCSSICFEDVFVTVFRKPWQVLDSHYLGDQQPLRLTRAAQPGVWVATWASSERSPKSATSKGQKRACYAA